MKDSHNEPKLGHTMETALETLTWTGLGISGHADSFQRGREAAQMAQHQLPGGSSDLILVLSQPTIHTQDFIEGTRLITQEDALIGIPTPYFFSETVDGAQEGSVIMVRSLSQAFTLASVDIDAEKPLLSLTSFFTQLREERGNRCHNFPSRGLFLFCNSEKKPQENLMRHILAEVLPETWVVGLSPLRGKIPLPLVCRNKRLDQGLMGIECLSQEPWGVSSVNIDAFINQKDIVTKAAHTCLLDAMSLLRGRRPALLFLLLNLQNHPWKPGALQEMVRSHFPEIKNVPFVYLPTNNLCVRAPNRPVSHGAYFIAVVAVPA